MSYTHGKGGTGRPPGILVSEYRSVDLTCALIQLTCTLIPSNLALPRLQLCRVFRAQCPWQTQLHNKAETHDKGVASRQRSGPLGPTRSAPRLVSIVCPSQSHGKAWPAGPTRCRSSPGVCRVPQSMSRQSLTTRAHTLTLCPRRNPSSYFILPRVQGKHMAKWTTVVLVQNGIDRLPWETMSCVCTLQTVCRILNTTVYFTHTIETGFPVVGTVDC
jgi:hypothetical protein